MRDDVRYALEQAAARPRQQLPMDDIHRRARRSKLLKAVAVGSSAAILAVAAAGIVMLAPVGERDTNPAAPDSGTPSPQNTEEASPAPTEDEESPEPRDLDWPAPFVPASRTEGGRELVPVVLPDRTAFTLSYPSDLELVARGVQVTVSYAFEDGRPSGPHEVIFVPGDVPSGLLDPEPLATFEGTPFPSTLHSVAYEHLLGDPPFALVYETEQWTIVATLPRREDAETVAENLHPSVTADGWPSVSAGGPIAMSEGFGQARGSHLEIGDADPIFDSADAGPDFRYIVMGPSNCRREDGVQGSGAEWYGSKCLELSPGGPVIFVSIYGPEQFVRSVFEGLELQQ